MKLKIIIIFHLFCGIAVSQVITDTTNVNFESIKKFEENLNTIQTDIDKLNKTISHLDSLYNSNQIEAGSKFQHLKKLLDDQTHYFHNLIEQVNLSIEKNQLDLSERISNNTEALNQNQSNTNLHLNELTKLINSLTDNLLTDANSIIRIKQQNSFNEAFLMARLTLGANQKFEWNGKLYKTDYKNEMIASPIVIAIDSLKLSHDIKSKELDNAIILSNARIDTLNEYIAKLKNENKNQINSLDQSFNEKINNRTLFWIITILMILLLFTIVFFVLKSKVAKQQDSISFVKDIQKKLENEAIQLDAKLINILEQKLDVAQHQPQKTEYIDHSLPLKLGEEIHRMRKRLKTMGESQGTKVLNKRIDTLEEKINDMGYEIVELEGKYFDEGMTLNVLNIIEREDLKENQKIISRVIKPQIKFQNEIIQPGDVEIAQGTKEY